MGACLTSCLKAIGMTSSSSGSHEYSPLGGIEDQQGGKRSQGEDGQKEKKVMVSPYLQEYRQRYSDGTKEKYVDIPAKSCEEAKALTALQLLKQSSGRVKANSGELKPLLQDKQRVFSPAASTSPTALNVSPTRSNPEKIPSGSPVDSASSSSVPVGSLEARSVALNEVSTHSPQKVESKDPDCALSSTKLVESHTLNCPIDTQTILDRIEDKAESKGAATSTDVEPKNDPLPHGNSSPPHTPQKNNGRNGHTKLSSPNKTRNSSSPSKGPTSASKPSSRGKYECYKCNKVLSKSDFSKNQLLKKNKNKPMSCKMCNQGEN